MSADPLQPYRDAARAHGGGFDATLWGSPHTQSLRFEVLAEMLGASLHEGATVLDLGCGDGALTHWLRGRGVQATVTGLDGVAEMIDVARSRCDIRARYELCDLLAADAWPLDGGFDVVVISGTLNTMDGSSAQGVLEAAWKRCGDAMAFNFLGDPPGEVWRDRPLGPARRHPIEAMERWARLQSDEVSIRSDYLEGHDVSIRLRRQGDGQPVHS